MENSFLPPDYKIPRYVPHTKEREYPTEGSKPCQQLFMQLEELYNLVEYFDCTFHEEILGNTTPDPETGEYTQEEEKYLNLFYNHLETLDQLIYCKTVDGFEHYISQIVKEVIKEKGNILNFKLSFDIPINTINTKDLENEVENQIDNKLLERYSANKKELCKMVSKDLGIDLIPKSKEDEIKRIFELRNTFTHTNGVINERVHKKLNSYLIGKSLALNDKITLTKKELLTDLFLITEIIFDFDAKVIDKYKLSKYKIEQPIN